MRMIRVIYHSSNSTTHGRERKHLRTDRNPLPRAPWLVAQAAAAPPGLRGNRRRSGARRVPAPAPATPPIRQQRRGARLSEPRGSPAPAAGRHRSELPVHRCRYRDPGGGAGGRWAAAARADNGGGSRAIYGGAGPGRRLSGGSLQDAHSRGVAPAGAAEHGQCRDGRFAARSVRPDFVRRRRDRAERRAVIRQLRHRNIQHPWL